MKKNKTFEEQLQLFIDRGITVGNRTGAIKKLENISYYKLKEYAEPFIVGYDYQKNPIYQGVSFEDLLKIYYKDKNLRIQLLHAIEKVEISLKTRIAYSLGDLDEYGYIRCEDWMDRNNKEITKKGRQIVEDYSFCSKNKIVEYDFTTGKKIIKQIKKYPSVWHFVNKLTFGEMVIIFESMNKKRKRKVAQYYDMDLYELNSWIYSIKLIRNLCSHNGRIVDIKLKSRPRVRKEWEKYINIDAPTDLALICCILNEFIKVINKKYDFRKLKRVLYRAAIDEKMLHNMGFKEKSSINIIFNKKNNI